MSKIDDLQRLEFINSLQRTYEGTLARQELQSTIIARNLFDENYDLENSRDVGRLLSNISTTIDQELKPELYDYITTGMKSITQIGVTQAVNNSLKVMGNTAFEFLNINDRLALDYINRVGTDGLRLSDRIWGQTDKEAISKEVFSAIREGKSKYQLAEDLQKVVTEGTPRFRVKSIADTELTYAYTHAKVDTMFAETELFPNAEAYVQIKLSPAHRIFDICDALVGTYRLEDAPLPPFHPICKCIPRTFMKIKDTQGRVNHLQTQLDTNKSLVSGHTIETINRTITIPKKD